MKKDKYEKAEALLCLVSCILTAVLVTLGVTEFFLNGAMGNMIGSGVGIFKYYTIDSNIFCALGCLAAIPYAIRRLRGEKAKMPHIIALFRYSGTVSLLLTFTVVLCYLLPTIGVEFVYGGSNLFLHFICPLLSVLMTVFWEKGAKLGKADILYGILPTVGYGVLYIVAVVYIGIWDDIYNFVFDGVWIYSVLAVIAVITVFAVLVRKLYNRNQQ